MAKQDVSSCASASLQESKQSMKNCMPVPELVLTLLNIIVINMNITILQRAITIVPRDSIHEYSNMKQSQYTFMMG